MSDNSNTSDDLPDIFAPESNEPWQVSVNEVVWAKYRDGLYWPSLVRRVFKKKKKVLLWYLDAPKQGFKVSFKNILNFSDTKSYELVRSAVIQSSERARHEKLVWRTRAFIYRRATGIIDDPAAFFDTSRPYFTLLNNNDSSESDEDNDCSFIRRETISENFPSSDEENNETSDSDISISNHEQRSIQSSPELYITENSLHENTVDDIVTCIKSGLVNEHLLNILEDKVESSRNKVFEEAMKVNKRDLLFNNISEVYISNREKLTEISLYLLDFYESVRPNGNRQYLFYVWIPEALDKALEIVRARYSPELY